MKLFITLLLLSVTLLFSAEKSQRVALLIANSDYDDVPLIQVENDQFNLQTFLESKGFDVISVKNVTKRETIKAIRAFEDKLIYSSEALFYYGGHSVSLNAKNYLVPYDNGLDSQESIKKESIPLSKIVNIMESTHNKINILLLDLHTSEFGKYGDDSATDELDSIALLSSFSFYIHISALDKSRFMDDFIALYHTKATTKGLNRFKKRYLVHIGTKDALFY